MPSLTQTESQRKRENPYLGPRPFTQADAYRFFGRDREAAELCSLVAAHRTVLLYSQSGAGKSSLLNAAVIPMLETRGFNVFPTARVSGASEATLPPGIDNIYIFNCMRFWGEDNPSLSATLSSLLNARPLRRDASGNVLPPVVVFDQFEELFTAYPGRWQQREGFFGQLSDAMTEYPTLRVLFAMREDFVAQIDPYEGLLPEEFRTRYRLEQLREEAAMAAVEGPLERTGSRFKPGVAKLLVSDLRAVRTGPMKDMWLPGEFVDPVQLQVSCFSLFRNLPPGTTEITEQHLTAFGDVDLALREFYRGALEETASKTGVDGDRLRQWFESNLITESGSRGLVFRGDKTAGGIANAALDALEEFHIIRADVRGIDRWYELSHDRFIQPILRANDEWRARVQQQRAVQEAAEREKEAAQKRELEQAQTRAIAQKVRADAKAKTAKRLRRAVFGLAAALIFATAASVYAFHQRREALEFANEARAAEKKAEQAYEGERKKSIVAATNAASAQAYFLSAQIARAQLQKIQRAVRLSPPSDQPRSSIKHLIVLMMENRSFDHMMGALKANDSRIDGLSGNESNADSTGSTVNVRSRAAFQGQLDPDPDHYFAAVDLQIFGGDTSPNRTANMQGFVKSYFNQSKDALHSQKIMYYFTPDQLPVLTTLATEFAVCDRWFSSVPGPSIPNRLFADYGTSFGQVGMEIPSVRPRYKSIYERLAEHGHTTKIYYYDTSSLLVTDAHFLKQHPEIFGTYETFLADAQSGTLPDYSLVEPNYNDHDSDQGEAIANDQHPDHNVQAGEVFIAQVYKAIRSNETLWRNSILLITYSSHGGIYDHVPPPAATPDGFVAQVDQTGTGRTFSFDRLGVRVPAVIVSPYIRRGTVDHTVYDHASIPATVSKLFLSGSESSSPRERNAQTFDRVLTLSAPRTDTPEFNLSH